VISVDASQDLVQLVVLVDLRAHELQARLQNVQTRMTRCRVWKPFWITVT